MTFLELKQALDALTPEQLANPVLWWGDERGGKMASLFVLPENYVRDADARLAAGTPVLITDEAT